MIEQNTASINSFGMAFIAFCLILIFLLPRRYSFLPLLVAVGFMTYGQIVRIEAFHFTIIRIIIFFCWIRLVIRKELHSLKLCKIDKVFISWALINFLVYSIREQTLQAVINRLGFLYNHFGIYFYFRYSIREVEDIKRIIKALLWISLPVAFVLIKEKLTGVNFFSYFGGVPEVSWTREGSIRAQGAFANPILAGMFGAIIATFAIGSLAWLPKNKIIGYMGLIASIIIVYCSASTIPLFSLFNGMLAMTFWKFRRQLKVVVVFSIALIMFLNLAMWAPVWHLFGKAGEVVGGTGWHRARLIDQAFERMDEWFFIGTSYTKHWVPFGAPDNPNHCDLTNEYIRQGVDGGILTLTLFLYLIVNCFKGIKISLSSFEENENEKKLMVWSIGSVFYLSIMAIMGVTYFDQMRVVWLLLCSMIALKSTDENKTIRALKLHF